MPTRIVAADGSGDHLNMSDLRTYLGTAPALTEPLIIQIKGVVAGASAGMTYPSGASATNYIEYIGVTPNAKITNSAAPTVSALATGVTHLRIRQLELESTGTAVGFQTTGSTAGYTLVFDRVKITQPNATASPGLTIGASPTSIMWRNVVFVGKTRGVDFRLATTGDVKVLNSVFWLTSGDYPALLHANTKVYNCYAGNAGTSTKDWLLAGTLTNGSNNASKDTSAVALTSPNGIGGVGVSAFTNTATYDFSLLNGSPLIDVGATLADVTVDINGTLRPQGSAYDIGAYEYSSGGGGSPVSFTGTVPTQNAVVGTPFNLALASYFSGTLTPFTYSVQSGVLPDGLTLAPDTGVISGTPTGAVNLDLQVRATDTGTNTAVTNLFALDIAAAGSPPAGTFTVGTITTTQTTASVPYTYSAVDADSIQYRIDGGVAVTAAASPQELTGLTAGTTYGIEFRAVNAFGNGAWSTSAPFTTAAAAVPSFTLTDLVNNAGAPIASTGSITVDVYNPSTGALVVRKTGLTSTAGADLVVSDAALTIGTTYNVFITIGTAIGAVKATAS